MNQDNTVGEISAMLGGHGVEPAEQKKPMDKPFIDPTELFLALRRGVETSNRINQRMADYLNAGVADEVQARKTARELRERECRGTGSPRRRTGVPFAEGEP
jgi:hypothetical protein